MMSHLDAAPRHEKYYKKKNKGGIVRAECKQRPLESLTSGYSSMSTMEPYKSSAGSDTCDSVYVNLEEPTSLFSDDYNFDAASGYYSLGSTAAIPYKDSSKYSKFESHSVAAENQKEIDGVLSAAKSLSPFELLLTFSAILQNYKLPQKAIEFVKAGFIAIPTRDTYCFGCPDCNLVIGPIPSDFSGSLRAFHKSKSPDCPFFQKSSEEKFDDDVAQQHTTGIAGSESVAPSDSMQVDQSLFTTASGAAASSMTSQGAASTEATPTNSTEDSNMESLDSYHKQKVLDLVREQISNYKINHRLKHFMCAEKHRKQSFTVNNLTENKITKRYAASGLYAEKDHAHSLLLKCLWCKFDVKLTKEMCTDAELASKNLENHVMEYRCEFIKGVNHSVPNIPDLFESDSWNSLTDFKLQDNNITDQLAGLGINDQPAKHPGMAVNERRKDSFLTYPSDTTQTVESLVDAGYFYSSGSSDTVVCFMCGLVSSNWSISETPWQRHTRSAPTCQHVIVQKGQEFIQSTIEQYGEYRESKNADKINNVTTRMLRPRMDSNVVQKAIDFKINRETVKTVVSKRIKKGLPDFKFLEEIVVAAHDLAVPESLLRNQLLTERKFPEVICEPHTVDTSCTEKDERGDGMERPQTPEPETESYTEPEPKASKIKEQEDIDNFGRDMDLNQLKSTLTCKICLTDLIGIIFVPCGHLVCCTSCAAAMTSCPICRKEVSGTIKANFS